MYARVLFISLLMFILTDSGAQSTDEAPPPYGFIIIFRVTGYDGALAGFNTFIDGEYICRLNNFRYTVHRVKAGQHFITIQYYGKKAKDNAQKISVRVDPGKTVMAEVIMDQNLFNPHAFARLLSPAKGKSYLAGTLPDGNCRTQQCDGTTAEALVKCGNERKRFGELWGAEEYFNQAITADSNYAAAYVARADLYRTRKKYKLGIEDCNRAIRLQSENASAYLERGILKFMMEEYVEAKVDIDQSIRISPQDPEAYLHRGVVWISLQQKDSACADFRRSREIRPKWKLESMEELVESVMKNCN